MSVIEIKEGSVGVGGPPLFVTPVGDHYALMCDRAVLGVIQREAYAEMDHWKFQPVVDGDLTYPSGNASLDVILKNALSFKPRG